MKISGRFDAVPSCIHRSKYSFVVLVAERTDLVSHIVSVVQQPHCKAFQSVSAQLWSKPRRLVVETEYTGIDTGPVITKCLRQQVREPSNILLESCACVFVPHPSVVRICTKTMYGDDAD